jgi:glycosyltransferase involved in cell wall biosynthesis
MYPNCVDPNLYAPGRLDGDAPIALRRRLAIDRDALLCTFVGTFGRWHGAEVLAQAIAEWYGADAAFLQKHKIVFLFVGDGQMMPEVRRRLAWLVDSEFVRFAGIVPHRDAPQYLAASDILLSPHVANMDGSPFFGSPTKLFEYMAMAKPIVASDLEQIGEVLRPSLAATSLPLSESLPRMDDKYVAILCRPGVPEDIRRGIAFLARNPAWRDLLGCNARTRVLERYTWEHHIRAVVAS